MAIGVPVVVIVIVAMANSTSIRVAGTNSAGGMRGGTPSSSGSVGFQQ